MLAFDREGSGRPVVLVHGITESRRAWDPIATRLAADHDVVAVDLRGHGDSPRTPPYNLMTLVGDVSEVVDSAGVGDPLLVGHSLGGAVVTADAALFDSRGVVNVEQPLQLGRFREVLRSLEPSLRGGEAEFTEAVEGLVASERGRLPDDEWQRLEGIRRLDQEVVLGIWATLLDTPTEDLDRAERVAPLGHRGALPLTPWFRPGPGVPGVAHRTGADRERRGLGRRRPLPAPGRAGPLRRASRGVRHVIVGHPLPGQWQPVVVGLGVGVRGPTGEELDGVAATLVARFPDGQRPVVVRVPDPGQLDLPVARVVVPSSLSGICSTDPRARSSHTYGKSFRDVVRSLAGDLAAAPDVVARPEREQDLVDLLDWCSAAGCAAVPFGGGSSVVGGVEGGAVRDRFEGVVAIDLTELSGVVEVDRVSRAARSAARPTARRSRTNSGPWA